jgi:uncharacterized protein
MTQSLLKNAPISPIEAPPMKKQIFLICTISLTIGLLSTGFTSTAGAETIQPANRKIAPPTDAWRGVVEKNAPGPVSLKGPKPKLLVFSLFTGYDHKVIPHVDAVLDILAKTSGAFDPTFTCDIEKLSAASLAGYDALVLNNNCSVGPRRNLFLDELERNPKYKDLTTTEREAKATELEKSILDFVRSGKGLVAIHGASTMLKRSPEFTDMMGCAFDYHPPSQPVEITQVDPNHPLVAAFNGKTPFIHTDEPYCFKGTYADKDFRPLLVMDNKKIKDSRDRFHNDIRYVAWIKRYGKGPVFYCSPSHYPESYESATLLQFLLDGTRYTLGQINCDDSVPEQK